MTAGRALACDNCAVLEAVPDPPLFAKPRLPPGWVTISETADGRERHLCPECARSREALKHLTATSTGNVLP
jgi:hypothetical protein